MKRPKMLDASPKVPTMTTSFGLVISVTEGLITVIKNLLASHVPGVLKKRSTASINIEKQSANKNTPFISAARISALCHP